MVIVKVMYYANRIGRFFIQLTRYMSTNPREIFIAPEHDTPIKKFFTFPADVQRRDIFFGNPHNR
jgi:hypothetical protein